MKSVFDPNCLEDVGLFYQTSAAVFRSSCFFNSLLRSRPPTIIQKTFREVRHSISKNCSSHCGASTRHELVNQWHEILHEWNTRVDYWVHASGFSWWSKRCMTQYWNFASYIANLPAERWVRRALAWQPLPTHLSRGRPQQASDTKLEMSCRYRNFGQ